MSSLLARLIQRTDPIRQAVLDLVFPPHCAGCGRWGALLCTHCREAITPIPAPVCPRCGRPTLTPNLCAVCRRDPPPLTAIRSAAVFDGPLRAAIHRLKYRGQQSLARPLGMLMAEAWPSSLFDADGLIPVPLHPSRERERGYNQAYLLAKTLGQHLGLPVIGEALYRIRPTQPQVYLDAPSRRENVANAFAAGSASVKGRRLVLIDDVCTTAATLSACAEALWQAGAAQVWAYTLARAAWDPARPEALSDRVSSAVQA